MKTWGILNKNFRKSTIPSFTWTSAGYGTGGSTSSLNDGEVEGHVQTVAEILP
jgi:hypothetical protein